MNHKPLLYEMIFKRKSFHTFKNTGDEKISLEELCQIEETFRTFKPLVKEIKTDIRIVPADATTCKRGQEYCILLYSEKKDNHLQNIGYIGEQLDLYLASMNIGALWFGFGKTEDVTYNGLDFIMMIAIKKVPEDKFRKNMYKSKRKPLTDIWDDSFYQDIGNIVRFTPSACNTQPWKVKSSEDKLEVFRYKEPGKRGMMPVNKVTFANRIDIGIFLLFLELCLQQEKLDYDRTIYNDSKENDETVMTLVATYRIKNGMSGNEKTKEGM